MKRNHLKGLLSMLLSLVSLYGQAQEVTYIHERDIMNQFTTMKRVLVSSLLPGIIIHCIRITREMPI